MTQNTSVIYYGAEPQEYYSMYIMNYLQSFLPNGLVNANGSLQIYSSVSEIYKYDFEQKKWVDYYSNIINLDHNGVANGLYKFRTTAALHVKDVDGEIIRDIQLPYWDDEDFDYTVALVRASITALNEKRNLTFHYLNQGETLDLTAIQPPPVGWHIVLNIASGNYTTQTQERVIYNDELGNSMTRILRERTFFLFFFNSDGRGIKL